MVPLISATTYVEHERRVGVEILAGATRAVREFGCSGERRGVRDGPKHTARAEIDRRRIPRAAAGVHVGITPNIPFALDRVEAPTLFAGRLVECFEDSAIATRVDTPRADGHRADQH